MLPRGWAHLVPRQGVLPTSPRCSSPAMHSSISCSAPSGADLVEVWNETHPFLLNKGRFSSMFPVWRQAPLPSCRAVPGLLLCYPPPSPMDSALHSLGAADPTAVVPAALWEVDRLSWSLTVGRLRSGCIWCADFLHSWRGCCSTSPNARSVLERQLQLGDRYCAQPGWNCRRERESARWTTEGCWLVAEKPPGTLKLSVDLGAGDDFKKNLILLFCTHYKVFRTLFGPRMTSCAIKPRVWFKCRTHKVKLFLFLILNDSPWKYRQEQTGFLMGCRQIRVPRVSCVALGVVCLLLCFYMSPQDNFSQSSITQD